MFSLENVLFEIGGQSVSLLEFIAVLLGLSTVFLATRGKVLNFWVGYFYNAFLFAMFLQKQLYSNMLIQPVSLILNIFGHYRWTHPAENEKDRKEALKITVLTNIERLLLLLIVALFTLCWGTILGNIHNWLPVSPARAPYLDSFVTAFILLAQYLSAQKKLDCWGAWLVVNITNVILYIKAGLVFMPIVSSCYLIMAFFGFGMWFKKKKQQDLEDKVA